MKNYIQSPGTFADLETEMEDDSLQKQNSLELALNLASPMSPILTLEQLRKSVWSLIFSTREVNRRRRKTSILFSLNNEFMRLTDTLIDFRGNQRDGEWILS